MDVTFNYSMMDGSTKQVTGHLFLIYQGGRAVPFVAHAIAGGYAISHLPTGRRVESCTTTQTDPVTLYEAISGFRAQVEVGATNLMALEAKAAQYTVVNPDWSEQVTQHAGSVRAFTELSTAHLRPEDVRVIGCLIASEEWESALSGASGAMVWRGYARSTFCPEPLKAILEQMDTDYALFDSDAPIHPRFQTFDHLWD